jgi:hypothetical protein
MSWDQPATWWDAPPILTELHAVGVISDEQFAALRERAGERDREYRVRLTERHEAARARRAALPFWRRWIKAFTDSWPL